MLNAGKVVKKKAMKEACAVLIAEDNATVRKLLSSQLATLGFDVVATASTGREACALYNKFKPGLVIMDIKMPEMDGIEAARLMTSSMPVPIILITGHSSDALVDRAIESGVSAYLLKPITKKNLVPAIRLAFARHSEFRTLKEEVNDLKQALETRKLVERAKGILMKRLNLSEEEAFKILQSRSQQENKKLKDIAEIVITASELL